MNPSQIAKLASVAAMLAIGAACTGSGLGQPTTTDVPATGGVPTGGGGGGDTCEWEGTWELSKAWCGTFGIDNEWFAVYSSTQMVIQDDGSGDGTCEVAFRLTGASCEEEEDWKLTGALADASIDIDFEGISSCNPDSCTFTGTDAACAIGDRADGSQAFDNERQDDSLVRITGLLMFAYPQCGEELGLTTQWSKQ